MGLNAARPLHMKFPLTQELENIGRRRKVTVDDRERKDGPKPRYPRCPAPDSVFLPRRPQQESDNLQLESVSIRIGSNIHQSQSTMIPHLSHRPASEVCQSGSSESMLLDKELSTCRRSIDLESNSKMIVMASTDSRERPECTKIAKPLISLEQVRDSETFDEVKAKSDSISKQDSANQQQLLPKSINRRVANRSLASEGPNSSSVAVGRHLLQSTPLHSDDSGLRPMTGGQLSKPAPGSLSSNFLPAIRGSDDNYTARPRSSSYRNQKMSSKPLIGVIEPRASCLASDSSQNQLHDRSKFTLELQAEAEAQAAETADVSIPLKHHIDSVCSKPSKRSPLSRHHSKPAGDDTDKASGPAYSVREEKTSKPSESSPASTDTRHCATSGQKNTRTYPGIGQSLWCIERAKGPEAAHRDIRASSDMLPGSNNSPDRVQPRQTIPMRQRLGVSQRPDHQQSDRRHTVAAQSDESQPWPRFVLQDGQMAMSNSLGLDPETKAHSARATTQCWLRHRPNYNDPLREERELLQSSSSPVRTIGTTANTTIHLADSDSRSVAPGKAEPSETDFLSLLSPMEGQLDERLFNPSVYTNPACTERSYIAAPSQTQRRCGHVVQSCSRGQFCTDVHYSSAAYLTYDDSHVQTTPRNGSPAPFSYSVTPTSCPSANRKPLEPITNLFTEPRHSPFQPLRRTSGLCMKAGHRSNMNIHASEQGSSGGQRTDPELCAHGSFTSTRRPINTFPMSYTPIKRTPSRRRPIAHHPSSSHSIGPQSGPNGTGMENEAPHHIPQSKIPYHLQSSPYLSIQQPDSTISADECVNFQSTPNRRQPSHQHDIATTSPIIQPFHHTFDTPPQAAASPLDHFTFTKPRPFLGLNCAPPNTHNPPSNPVTPRQVEAFTTPGPMRTPFIARHSTPFSTPRPVRPVLGDFKRQRQSNPLMNWV